MRLSSSIVTENERKMFKINKRFLTIIISGVIFVSLVVFFSIRSTMEKALEVKVVKVELRNIKQIISSTGSIEPETRVRISSKIKEKIAELNFNELDHVQKGDIIARLDDTGIKARLNQAQAGLLQAKTDSANAAILLKRIKDLFKKNIASQQELDDAQMLFNIKEAQVTQQEAIIEAIQAELKDAIIESPISGTIIRKYVEEGEMVGLLTVGLSPIVEIAKLDSFEAHTNVDETDIGKINEGMTAEIRVDAYPDILFDGEVGEIALSSLEKKETGINYIVKVKINNKDNIPLRIGMTSNVNFIVTSKEQVPAVPLWSIVQKDDKEYVFVVNDNRLHQKEVKSGIKGEEFAEIISGVKAGQICIKSSAGKLEDGARIKIKN